MLLFSNKRVCIQVRNKIFYVEVKNEQNNMLDKVGNARIIYVVGRWLIELIQ